MAKYYLTDTVVKSLKCEIGKPQKIIWDHPCTIEGVIKNGSQSGLGIRLTASGSKAFIHSYRFNGLRHRRVLGPVSKLNVGSARLLTQNRNRMIDQGIDPDAASTNFQKKHAITIKELCYQYFEDKLSTRSKSHKDEFTRVVAPWLRRMPPQGKYRDRINPKDAFGGRFENISAEVITPEHIQSFLKSIKSDTRANSALRQLKAMFNWAIRMQILNIRNPCDPLDLRQIIKQRRDYTPDQVREIALHVFNPPPLIVENLSKLEGEEKRLAALKAGQAAQSNQNMLELCNFMGILFLTMARPIELKRSLFSHFDLNNLIWHKHNTKGLQLSKATYEYAYRSVPIHPKVAELVRRQKARWPDSDLLFPNHADQTRPRDNFNKALKRFRELDGVPNHFQMYDLKRMAISMMLIGQGVRREDVSHYVDHKGNIETTMIYDLGFVDPMRPVTEKLGELLGV